MFTKKRTAYFLVLFLPVFIASTLIDLLYSLQVREYVKIDWLMVVLIAIALDAFITWSQTRKQKEKPGDNLRD